jgi:hypothetical protein
MSIKLEVGKKYHIKPKCADCSLPEGDYVFEQAKECHSDCMRDCRDGLFRVEEVDRWICAGFYTFTPLPQFTAGDLVDVFVFSEKPEHTGVKLLFNNEHGFAVEVSTSCKRYFWKDTFTELRPHTPQPQLEIGAVYKAVHKKRDEWSVGVYFGHETQDGIGDVYAFQWGDRGTEHFKVATCDYTFTKLVEASK